MKKKSTSQSARVLIALLVCGAAFSIITGTLRALLPDRNAGRSFPSGSCGTDVCRARSYQRAIEDVYWRHRIWPKENSNPKPSLDAVMSQAQLEEKVEDYLRKSQALEDYWQGRSQPSSCKLRWIAWRSTPSSPRCCANSLLRSGTIRLSSRNVWPGPC